DFPLGHFQLSPVLFHSEQKITCHEKKMSPATSLQPVHLDAIPLLLRHTPHWVLWRRARLITAADSVSWTANFLQFTGWAAARLRSPDPWTDFASAAAA